MKPHSNIPNTLPKGQYPTTVAQPPHKWLLRLVFCCLEGYAYGMNRTDGHVDLTLLWEGIGDESLYFCGY
jgi:hypothetical protein